MKRDSAKLLELYPDVTGKTLPGKEDYGTEGEFFVGAKGSFGQDSDSSVINYNDHPSTQPGLWCQWIINEDGEIEWDESEKFYCAGDWMIYIINNFLAPNGYTCNGIIEARGEEDDDIWRIDVSNNVVSTVKGEITYGESSELTVDTDAGQLKAVKSTDPPGILVTVNGEAVALIEKREDDLSVRTVLYDNNEDDFNHIHYHDQEDKDNNREE